MEKLEVRHVSKAFDGRSVLEDVSLTLREGELVCLLGVSGGGKSTLFNIISGLLKPDAGQVFLDGEEVTGRPGKISYMLQKDLLLPEIYWRGILGKNERPNRPSHKEGRDCHARRRCGEPDETTTQPCFEGTSAEKTTGSNPGAGADRAVRPAAAVILLPL